MDRFLERSGPLALKPPGQQNLVRHFAHHLNPGHYGNRLPLFCYQAEAERTF